LFCGIVSIELGYNHANKMTHHLLLDLSVQGYQVGEQSRRGERVREHYPKLGRVDRVAEHSANDGNELDTVQLRDLTDDLAAGTTHHHQEIAEQVESHPEPSAQSRFSADVFDRQWELES
jgi:hypothetical protein